MLWVFSTTSFDERIRKQYRGYNNIKYILVLREDVINNDIQIQQIIVLCFYIWKRKEQKGTEIEYNGIKQH